MNTATPGMSKTRYEADKSGGSMEGGFAHATGGSVGQNGNETSVQHFVAVRRKIGRYAQHCQHFVTLRFHGHDIGYRGNR